MDAPRPIVWSIGAGLLLLSLLVAALAPGVGAIPPIVSAICGIAILAAAFIESRIGREADVLLLERDVSLPDFRIVEALHPEVRERPARPARGRTQGATIVARASTVVATGPALENGPEVVVPLARRPVPIEEKVDAVIRERGVVPRPRRATRAAAKRPKKAAGRKRSHGRREIVVSRRSR